jgi:hypothetical protein
LSHARPIISPSAAAAQHLKETTMTAQFAEELLYEGEQTSMCSTPLADYFAAGGRMPQFRQESTALWRGYVGSWEVVGGRLYLVGLRGTLLDGTEAHLESVFPGQRERVFADWFSGTVRIPQGRQVKYVHMGFLSTWERDLLVEFEHGVVRSTRAQHNDVAEGDAL